MIADGLKILLIEDNPGDAQLVRLAIAEAGEPGTKVRHVDSLTRGLEALATGAIDVVLLDLGLPDSRGLDAIERIQKAAPGIPIVVLTGLDDESVAARAIRRGAHDYLVKGHVAGGPALLRILQHATDRRRARRQWRHLVTASPDGVVVVDRDRTILFANPVAASLLNRPCRDRLSGETFPFPLSAGEVTEVGSERHAEMRVAETDWGGQPVYLVTLRDIRERKRSETAIRDLNRRLRETNRVLTDLATLDPLTGLLNRRGLENVLDRVYGEMERSGGPVVVGLLDIDDFKAVNDRYGHAVGDRVLKTIAERMSASLRASDHIARIGGDEFLILLPDSRIAEGIRVAERLRLATSDRAIECDTDLISASVSAGVATLELGQRSIAHLLASTGSALGRSKAGGKNRVCAGATGIHGSAGSQIEQRLRTATAYRVLCRPLVRLSDDRIVGYRLLPRAPDTMFEEPRHFLALAREHDLLPAVDLCALTACIKMAPHIGNEGLLHIRLLPSTVLDTTTEQLLTIVSSAGDPSRFCIEISEQELLGDLGPLPDRLRELKAAGVSIALADVGFARGSLESLILMEADFIKVSPSYVEGLAESPGRVRALGRLSRIARSLDTALIAEDVRSLETRGLLREIGVQLGEGDLWGEPVPLPGPGGSVGGGRAGEHKSDHKEDPRRPG